MNSYHILFGLYEVGFYVLLIPFVMVKVARRQRRWAFPWITYCFVIKFALAKATATYSNLEPLWIRFALELIPLSWQVYSGPSDARTIRALLRPTRKPLHGSAFVAHSSAMGVRLMVLAGVLTFWCRQMGEAFPTTQEVIAIELAAFAGGFLWEHTANQWRASTIFGPATSITREEIDDDL